MLFCCLLSAWLPARLRCFHSHRTSLHCTTNTTQTTPAANGGRPCAHNAGDTTTEACTGANTCDSDCQTCITTACQDNTAGTSCAGVRQLHQQPQTQRHIKPAWLYNWLLQCLMPSSKCVRLTHFVWRLKTPVCLCMFVGAAILAASVAAFLCGIHARRALAHAVLVFVTLTAWGSL